MGIYLLSLAALPPATLPSPAYAAASPTVRCWGYGEWGTPDAVLIGIPLSLVLQEIMTFSFHAG